MASQKILVIDDSKVIQRMVKDMLPTSFDIVQALDGEEGIKQIASANPNLIMLDFLLPKVSGWEVFQHLEKLASNRGKMIPLVLMSGRKPEVTEKIPEPFKYFEFIEKPFQQKQLISAIKVAIQKSKDFPTHPDATPKGDGQTVTVNAEIAAIKQQMAAMQNDINTLKKQLTQVVTLIKQKLK